MLTVFLTVFLSIVGFHKNLESVPVEICTFSDADVVLENKVSEKITHAKTDGAGKVPLEAAFSVVLF